MHTDKHLIFLWHIVIGKQMELSMIENLQFDYIILIIECHHILM